jgi:uncharacterized membrane protein YbhN (UPF0104 family)
MSYSRRTDSSVGLAAEGKYTSTRRETPSTIAGMARWLAHLVRVALAVAILGWLIHSGGLEVDRLLALRISWGLVLLFAIVGASLLLAAVRWWWLLEIQELRLSLGSALRLTWVGNLSTLFLPGSLGADVVRGALAAADRPGQRLAALSTVVADRFLGLYSLTLLGLGPALSVWGGGERPPALAAVAGTLTTLWACMTVAALALAWAPSRRFAGRLLPRGWSDALDASAARYRARAPAMLGCLGLAALGNALLVAGLAWGIRLLGAEGSMLATFAAAPLAILGNLVPLTPGGAGVGEAVAERLFHALGVEGGAETMLLNRGVAALLSLPALALLWDRRWLSAPEPGGGRRG